MATGFPWTAESHVNEPTYLNEKAGLAPAPSAPAAPPIFPPINTETVKSPTTQAPVKHVLSIHGHGHGKRRAGSLKQQHASAKASYKSSTDSPVRRDAPGQLAVRTIPAWVRDADESDLEEVDFEIPTSPTAAKVAQHNHSPSAAQQPLLSARRRDQDENVMSSGQTRRQPTSRWVSFARASAYPRETFNGGKVEPEWLDENYTDYSKPWLADHNDDDEDDGSSRYRAFRKKREAWYRRAQFTILRNPFIPLTFRFTVLAFAIVALGLGISIFVQTGRVQHCIEQEVRSDSCVELVGPGSNGRVDFYRDPSALMAIIVDAIAIVYTIYITYDEYFSKPLGLRPARDKVRLVLLDIFFIVFQSANLSLSFESLSVIEGACKSGEDPLTTPKFDLLCNRQEALSSVLLVSLVAWLLTFSVSVLRLVERLNAK